MEMEGASEKREKKSEQEMGSTVFSQGQAVSCIEWFSSVKVKRQRKRHRSSALKRSPSPREFRPAKTWKPQGRPFL